MPLRLALALFLALPLFADEPSPEALKQEIAALQQQLAAQKIEYWRMVAQTTTACYQSIQAMTATPATPKPPAKETK